MSKNDKIRKTSSMEKLLHAIMIQLYSIDMQQLVMSRT